MNLRMTVATWIAIAASATALSACGSSDETDQADPSSPSTTSTADPTPSPSATPSVDSSTDGAIAIRGDWEAPDADWIVHFQEDGSYSEDFQGVTDFRVGTYEVDGETVRLIGDDGNTDEGKVSGSGDDLQIAFNLGTLTRQ